MLPLLAAESFRRSDGSSWQFKKPSRLVPSFGECKERELYSRSLNTSL